MASPALLELWEARLLVTDFGALSAGGVFDEIGISASVAKGEGPSALRSPVSLLLDVGIARTRPSA